MDNRAWIESVSRLSRSLEATLRPSQQLAEIAEQSLRFQTAVQRQMAPVLEAHRRLQEGFLRQAESLRKITVGNQQIQDWLRTVQRPVLPPHLHEELAQWPARMRQAIQALAARGWYVDPGMPLPGVWRTAALVAARKDEEADRVLADYFDGRAEASIRALAQRFPARAAILEQAYNAHRRGEFALSVPVLLAQADGICRELTGMQLYRRRKGRPQIAVYIEQNVERELRTVMLAALIEPGPVMALEHEVEAVGDRLNRHEVLHGVSVDYHTRLNSLRALSLLWYVGAVLGDEQLRLPKVS